MLSDNIFHGVGLSDILRETENTTEQEYKATVFGYWFNDMKRYGVAGLDNDRNCLPIEGKPENPKSNYAVIGLFFYTYKAVEVANNIKHSAPGEFGIDTVNQEFLKVAKLKIQTLPRDFAWLDTETHDSF